MPFKSGTTSAVYVANAANALQNLSPYIDNVSLPNSTAQLDVSVFGTSAKAFIPGQTFGDTLSLSGPYDVTFHTHMTALQAAQAAGSAAAGFIFGPGGSVASQARFAGSVYVASYSTSSTASGRVEYSCDLQVTGAVAAGTF